MGSKFLALKWRIAIIGAVAVTMVLGMIVAPNPIKAVDESIETVDPASRLIPYEPVYYGVTYLYPYHEYEWEPEDVPAIEAALQQAADMGLTTIIQVFPSALVGSGNESRWNFFLDAADALGIKVVAYLWPDETYTENPDDPFDYTYLKAFIDEVGDHPALIGFLGLHQPLDAYKDIDTAELQAFYTEMKNYAPHLKIAHYMGDIVYWDEHRDNWNFTEGQCDFCIIWHYPFCYVDGEPVYERDEVIQRIESHLALMGERDPAARLWFLGQAFAQSSHPRNLRMPTPEEMETLYLDVMQYPVQGFMWYPWLHGEYVDIHLSDPGNEDQQAMVGYIAETYQNYPKTYLPLIVK